MDMYAKKTDLQNVFNDALAKNESMRDFLISLWSKIRWVESTKDVPEYKSFIEEGKGSTEQIRAFCYEFATYVYVLMTDKDVLESDTYWSTVAQGIGELINKYGDNGSLPSQWVKAMFFVADDLVTGKRKVDGEMFGILRKG